mmetsp:Transcript_58666/g.154523  ORF Transcript_58666/g.154523 Transcript_58666/m.154523 type:complete len:200 (+) Transcript_58666:4258-4857(+)
MPPSNPDALCHESESKPEYGLEASRSTWYTAPAALPTGIPGHLFTTLPFSYVTSRKSFGLSITACTMAHGAKVMAKTKNMGQQKCSRAGLKITHGMHRPGPQHVKHGQALTRQWTLKFFCNSAVTCFAGDTLGRGAAPVVWTSTGWPTTSLAAAIARGRSHAGGEDDRYLREDGRQDRGQKYARGCANIHLSRSVSPNS